MRDMITSENLSSRNYSETSQTSFQFYNRSSKDLYEDLGDDRIRCLVCERRCVLGLGRRGLCRNYMNIDGGLVHVGYGVLSAVESRPIEIKPFFHYWPNSTALTFSGYGCNFYCPWCQNHHISFSDLPPKPMRISPEELVREALIIGDDGLRLSTRSI